MGFLDWLLGADERNRDEPISNVASLIGELVAARQSSFGVAQAMRMPPVARAVQLTCSAAAMFNPVMYRDGVPAPEQPRIVSRPSPFQTRYEFIYQTVLSGLMHGNAYWLLGDRDYNGFARTAIVLDPTEVSVGWDDKRLQEVITWRNRRLIAGVDVVHLAWGRRPGEVTGRSVIAESLDALSALDAAEEFAASYFLTAGVPSVVIKSSTALTKTEAEALKTQWINAHTGPQSTPAVLSGGVDLDFPGHDPQKSQLQETRAYAATVVARLFGIPAPLLLCETSGATITYLNGNAAFQGFLETTLAPTWLAPLESAWSDLVPSYSTVRFDTRELQRLDTSARFATYSTAISAGFMTADEARRLEGWPTDGQPVTSPLFAPLVPPSTRPVNVPEV